MADQPGTEPDEDERHKARPHGGLEEGGQGGGGDLDGLGEDEALDVAEGDFADDFLGAGVGVAGPDFEALGFEVDAGVGQLDAGGGHKQ